MGLKTVQFPAVLYTDKKHGFKLKKKTGRIWKEDDFYKGKLGAPIAKEACHCFLNDKAFLAIGFHRQISSGIGIVPGVAIPISKKMEIGEPHVAFGLPEVVDYKRMQSFVDGKRLVINTINNYVHIRPISDKTIDQPFRNRKLICKIHDEYEELGIRCAGGSGYTAKYDDPFLGWLENAFNYLANNGYIRKKPGFQAPLCPTHKITGIFVPEHNTFVCEKCKDYIR